mgnify:CR=1 FL=1
MNFPALWKEAGIDPESDLAELIKLLINEWYLKDGPFKDHSFRLLQISEIEICVERYTGLSWPRIQEILRSE